MKQVLCIMPTRGGCQKVRQTPQISRVFVCTDLAKIDDDPCPGNSP
jgi:hypothetical protein